MDKLDKLIDVKLREFFEQWPAPPNPFGPSNNIGWYNGAYAPSVPSKRAIGWEEEEDEKEDEEDIEEQEKEGSYSRGLASDVAMKERSLVKQLAARSVLSTSSRSNRKERKEKEE